MIELRNDGLVFSFPDVHSEALLRVEFQRTLRIPDDGRSYPLPPGLGCFPLRHVDDFARAIPAAWSRHGGVLLPMYQSEAMWINFTTPHGYPFAVKVATGKINAVTGEVWEEGLHRAPQDYMSIPEQPWLDGYVVEKGLIRQFVAMPLGAGYSVEEQLTGEAEHGGVQVIAYPLRKDVWERMRRAVPRVSKSWGMVMEAQAPYSLADGEVDMGLAPGGQMEQEIYEDARDFADWDTRQRSRVFVHLANSVAWSAITGETPPTNPPTAEDYTRAGLPWFEYYDADRAALAGAEKLRGLKSVKKLGEEKRQTPLPENASVDPTHVVKLRGARREGQVREGVF
jgi:hypothetical protein